MTLLDPKNLVWDGTEFNFNVLVGFLRAFHQYDMVLREGRIQISGTSTEGRKWCRDIYPHMRFRLDEDGVISTEPDNLTPNPIRWVDGKNEDTVNHPSHYTDGKIEVADFIADKNLNFFLGNVVKYVSRAGKKDPNTLIQDLEKANWYIVREIQRQKDVRGDTRERVEETYSSALEAMENWDGDKDD